MFTYVQALLHQTNAKFNYRYIKAYQILPLNECHNFFSAFVSFIQMNLAYSDLNSKQNVISINKKYTKCPRSHASYNFFLIRYESMQKVNSLSICEDILLFICDQKIAWCATFRTPCLNLFFSFHMLMHTTSLHSKKMSCI